MTNIKSIFAIAAAAFLTAFGLGGCKDVPEVNPDIQKGSNTWVVTVGMENSKFAGACPGAGIDAERMTKLLGSYATHIKAFSSETATKAAVTKAMKEAAANAELFIFYYSGHGGSEPFADTGSEETDGKDEFFCLYDTWMRDNEVWDIIKNRKGRTMIIADCCHSQTCFRCPIIFDLCRMTSSRDVHIEQGSQNLLVWSGCPDDTYSYGSSTGGKFTNTLLKYFDLRKTYDYLWNEIESDSNLKQYEAVQCTKIGSGFEGRPVFQ